jgi:hypothetical protein
LRNRSASSKAHIKVALRGFEKLSSSLVHIL